MRGRPARTGRPYEAEFDRALELWHRGDAEGAIEGLRVLAVRHPDEAAVRGMLGNYLYALDLFLEALPHLEAAVRLAPRSEVAARHLFHAYYGLDRLEDARRELQRFLSRSTSEEQKREWSKLLETVEARLRTV